ncbi:uncharacterized protein LOC130998629 [Salvia miltiorrhiza]|uniref:uncharacterized protein LOC130998629 n=1 Tax=Salvia miltiorrhiza TaxID=226208 RepID=UPI0025AD5EFE|nr:uncharacterized protein LOC130998629 [Salvia miltiorrhiza]
MTVTPLLNILSAKPLTGPNFLEWKRNLGFVLDAKEYKFVLTTPAPANLTARSSEEQREVHKRWHRANSMAKTYMMTTMSSALQLYHQSKEIAAAIMKNLEELFGESDRSIRFELMRKLMSSKMTEGSSYVLGGSIAYDTKVDMILHTLSKSYENFHLNAVMGKKKFTLNELLNELVTAEGVMGKRPQALATDKGPSFALKGWKKQKGLYGKKGQAKSGCNKLGTSVGVGERKMLQVSASRTLEI